MYMHNNDNLYLPLHNDVEPFKWPYPMSKISPSYS